MRAKNFDMKEKIVISNIGAQLILLSLTIIPCFAQISIEQKGSNKLIIKPAKLNWNQNWDFKARDLSLEQGYPSSSMTLVQPGLDWLEFHGFLGFFPREEEGKLVGFSQTTTSNIKFISQHDLIAIKARTLLPGFKFKLVLAYSDNHLPKCNYQVDFEPKKKLEEFEFKKQEFQCFYRGNLVADAPALEPEKITKLRFLITKSSQEEKISLSHKAIPFNLIIEEIIIN